VIADETVAKNYLHIMKTLGVQINLSKSIISSKGVVEFAKTLRGPSGNYSPVGVKALSQL